MEIVGKKAVSGFYEEGVTTTFERNSDSDMVFWKVTE